MQKPKLAFLSHNFRKLESEQKTVFVCNILTVLLCFTPWFSAEPIGDEPFFYNAFKGETFLVGSLVFLFALGTVWIFLDKLLDMRKFDLPFPENNLLGIFAGMEILLTIIAWSVLSAVGNNFATSEVRFGLFAVLLVQIISAVSIFLEIQKGKQKAARDFFQHPGVGRDADPSDAEE